MTRTVPLLLAFATRFNYFFISSSTASVMATTPSLIVGSGTGANLLECKLGSGAPVFSLSAIFAGSTAPRVE